MIGPLSNTLGWVLGMYLTAFAVAQPEPQPWLHYTGSPPDSVSCAEVGPTEVRLQGNGADIWSTSDSFDFVCQPWSGDGVFTARIRSFKAEHEWAKAGLMIRESLERDARHAFASVAYRKGANFIRRPLEGGETFDNSHHVSRRVVRDEAVVTAQRSLGAPRDAANVFADVPAERWLRLVRRGEVIQAFDSADGETWEWLGTDRVAMFEDVYVGLALSSHDGAQLAEVLMDSWTATLLPLDDIFWYESGVGIGSSSGATNVPNQAPY